MGDDENGYVSKYLTHFVGRGLKDDCAFEVLCNVLRSRRILPAGTASNWAGNVRISPQKALSRNELFLPETVCFCDIPLNGDDLRVHTGKYSKFGLAFEKVWLARNRGANPVFYLARGSCCTDHGFPEGHPRRGTTREQFFDLAAHDWMQQYFAPGFQRSRADNMFFWYFLCYCKFFDEGLDPAADDNYYMEREWRTIGQVPFEYGDIEKVIVPEAFGERLLREFPGIADLGCKLRHL